MQLAAQGATFSRIRPAAFRFRYRTKLLHQLLEGQRVLERRAIGGNVERVEEQNALVRVDRIGRDHLIPFLTRLPLRVRCLPMPDAGREFAHAAILVESARTGIYAAGSATASVVSVAALVSHVA